MCNNIHKQNTMSIILGPHVNRYHALTSGRPSIVKHIEAAKREALNDAGFNIMAAAIFVGGPKNREITLHPNERVELREYIARTKMCIIAHSSYSAYPWHGDPDAARYILEELKVCQESGITGLVIHLPKLPVSEVMKYIDRLFNHETPDVKIYFETPAVKPTESYYETPLKLATLFSAIRTKLDPNLDKFGLCIDSAHLWTCGIDLQSYDAAAAWLQDLESKSAIIPPKSIMFHLNDSLKLRGVGPDTHANLAVGKIWEKYSDNIEKSGLRAFTDYAQRHESIVILERKPKEALKKDYLILRRLILS